MLCFFSCSQGSPWHPHESLWSGVQRVSAGRRRVTNGWTFWNISRGNYRYFNQIEQLMTATIKINDVTLGTKHSTLYIYLISGNVWTDGTGGRGRVGWENYLEDYTGYWSASSAPGLRTLFCCRCSLRCQMNFLRSVFTHNKRCGLTRCCRGFSCGPRGATDLYSLMTLIDQTVS